ncbi:hypothetical protein [Tessaracoccus sp. OH4464_COT-324]|uniref:hypothetical protein n=1 Tax=Tessaracoccus sp. OH4464_COT-324 TaxID=2491059 RepID=UPI000F63DC61|nr:hypothetical protein [Tessaracoccus sp. OH4464_COT-324]RRD45766.1 hypothetical protein EII42_10225 [Tessaracoccus sp. OH4464_COT-324]
MYRWQTEPDITDALDEAGLNPVFPSQAEAEAWLGEFYGDIADLGASTVQLVEDSRVVLGPMSLLP